MDPTLPLPAGTHIDDELIWCQTLSPPRETHVGALFLDRDGTVIVETNYLHDPAEVELIAGAAEVIADANRAGIPVVLVTNQGGIGRGYFGWDELILVQERVLADLADAGARVDGVYACPYHDRGIDPFRHADHPARKPNAGMLTRAAEALGIDLARSWIVGDHASDVGAGVSAGLQGGVHVLTGHGHHAGQQEASLRHESAGYRVHSVPSIIEARAVITLFGGNGI